MSVHDTASLSSNTGRNSQELSEALTVKIDWIQVVTHHETLDNFKEMLSWLEEVIEDKITFYADKTIFRGCRWDGYGDSVKGVQVAIATPTCTGQATPSSMLHRGWVCIPGGVLKQLDAEVTYELCVGLHLGYSAIAKRIDIALDDYARSVKFSDVHAAAQSGNFAWAKSWHYYQSGRLGESLDETGESVVFGSPQSDKRLTFYNKAVESGGELQCDRWEVRLRDFKAHQVFEQFACLPRQQFRLEAAQLLGAIVTGSIDFIDREQGDKNLDRCPRLKWWQALIDRVGEVVRLPAKKRELTVSRSVNWLIKSVAPTLAMLSEVFGFSTYEDLMQQLMEGGKRRLSRQHLNAIEIYRQEWEMQGF